MIFHNALTSYFSNQMRWFRNWRKFIHAIVSLVLKLYNYDIFFSGASLTFQFTTCWVTQCWEHAGFFFFSGSPAQLHIHLNPTIFFA